MPEICRFFGIVIKMYIDDHPPPHFHATYGDYIAMFRISNGEILEGKFPVKERRIVTAFAGKFRKELLENWDKLHCGGKVQKINVK